MSIAGSAQDLRLKSVLMATDLSPASVKPLHHALAIAPYHGAKLYVAHVVSPIPYLMAGAEALQLGCEGASQDMQQLQRDLLHDGSLNGLDHEFIIRHGSVWEELQAIIFQKQVDLVVVGTHGRRGIEKVLLGSVAEQVFRDATCPVLTVGPHSYRESRVDLTGEIRHHAFETRTRDRPGCRPTQIFIHNFDLAPSQLLHAILHGILQLLAFQVVTDLVRGGLANIQNRLPLKMVWLDLVTHRPPPFCCRRRELFRCARAAVAPATFLLSV